MIDRLQSLTNMRDDFDKDFPGIAEQNKSLPKITRALLNESIELFEAVSLGLSAEEIADEAADVFWFLIVVFKNIGIDLYDAARNKQGYNLYRFSGYFKTPDSYATDYPQAKINEKRFNLKEAYNDGCLPIRNQN